MTANSSPWRRPWSGQADPDLDPQQEAVTLLALVDGLMIHAVMEPERAETMLTTLDYQLDRIFAGDSPAE